MNPTNVTQVIIVLIFLISIYKLWKFQDIFGRSSMTTRTLIVLCILSMMYFNPKLSFTMFIVYSITMISLQRNKIVTQLVVMEPVVLEEKNVPDAQSIIKISESVNDPMYAGELFKLLVKSGASPGDRNKAVITMCRANKDKSFRRSLLRLANKDAYNYGVKNLVASYRNLVKYMDYPDKVQEINQISSNSTLDSSTRNQLLEILRT